MDAGIIAALGREIVYVQWFAWLDIEDDPVCSVTGVQDITFGASQTGDPDLDGKTFEAIPADLIDVSDVQHSEGGSETVTASLSGLPIENSDLLDILGQKSKWRKREARLWFRVLEPLTYGAGGQPVTFTPLAIQNYYSGYIVGLKVDIGEEQQTITAVIENYQTTLTEGSGLTYLHQSEFDPSDKSAEQTLAAANGMRKAGVSGGYGNYVSPEEAARMYWTNR